AERKKGWHPEVPALSCMGSDAQRSAYGEGAGFFVDRIGVAPGDFELVELGDQLGVVVDVVKQRDAAGFVIGGGAQAVAIVLGLAIGQRDTVLAKAVGALQQVAVAVHLSQQSLTRIVGEER